MSEPALALPLAAALRRDLTNQGLRITPGAAQDLVGRWAAGRAAVTGQSVREVLRDARADPEALAPLVSSTVRASMGRHGARPGRGNLWVLDGGVAVEDEWF